MYTAQPISCYNHGDADPVIIQAYPTVSWQSDLSLGGEVDENRHVNWGLHGNIQINSNQNTYKLGADTSTPLDSIFENVQSFMNELLPMLGCLDRYSNGALNIKVDPPQLKLEGNLKNVENPQGFNVDYEGSLAVKLDPLFALEGEVDIVQWIIDCFPETKAASFLQSIVEKSENSDSFDVSIKLSCQDRIEGYTKWSKQPQQQWDYEHDLQEAQKDPQKKLGDFIPKYEYLQVFGDGKLARLTIWDGTEAIYFNHKDKDLSDNYDFVFMKKDGKWQVIR